MLELNAVDIRVGNTIAEAEKALLIATLNYNGGNKIASAKMLGVTSRTIYNLMRRYGLGLALKVVDV